jgi:hypothetical protein
VHNKVWTLEARFINNCWVANKKVTTFEQFQFELYGVLYYERTSKKEFTTIELFEPIFETLYLNSQLHVVLSDDRNE